MLFSLLILWTALAGLTVRVRAVSNVLIRNRCDTTITARVYSNANRTVTTIATLSPGMEGGIPIGPTFQGYFWATTGTGRDSEDRRGVTQAFIGLPVR
jgi:hypothetical protein